MKLLEVAPDFVRSQIGTLMTILQYLQSKTEPGTKIPMQNLTNLMQNAGYPFDWRALEGLKKEYKALDELIGDYDENSLTLGKSDEPEDDLGDIGGEEGGALDNIAPPEEPDMGMGAPTEPAPTGDVNVNDGANPQRQTVDKMAARASRF